MRALVIYESMYGNTRAVAEAIAEGIRPVHDVVVVPAGRAGPQVVDGATLLVVGGPTHAHGMTRRRSIRRPLWPSTGRSRRSWRPSTPADRDRFQTATCCRRIRLLPSEPDAT